MLWYGPIRFRAWPIYRFCAPEGNMDDKKDLRIVPQVKDDEWPLNREGGPPPPSKVRQFQEDYKEVTERDVAQWEGNRAQRSLVMASKELERLSLQMTALASEYGDPDEIATRLIENDVATRIAKAMSSARLVILFTLTPGAGSNS